MTETLPAGAVHKIHDDLLRYAMEVGDLTPDPANANTHDEQSILGIMNSLQAFGQDQLIVAQRRVDGALIVRKGNGRLEAARRLGWTHVAVHVVEESDTRATARAIADNQTAKLSRFDDVRLKHLLTAIGEDDETLTPQVLGFSAEDVARLDALDGRPPAAPEQPAAPDDFPSYDGDLPTEFKCPKCEYEWSGSPAPGGAAAEPEAAGE